MSKYTIRYEMEVTSHAEIVIDAKDMDEAEAIADEIQKRLDDCDYVPEDS